MALLGSVKMTCTSARNRMRSSGSQTGSDIAITPTSFCVVLQADLNQPNVNIDKDDLVCA